MTKTKKVKWGKIIEKQDWRELAEAFHEAQIDWHAKEWKEFIERIKKQVKREVLERVRLRKALIIPNLHQVFKKPIDRAGHIGTVTGYNRAVDLLNQKIKKEIEEK